MKKIKKVIVLIFMFILSLFAIIYLVDVLNMVFFHPFDRWGAEALSSWWYYKSPIHYLLNALLNIIVNLGLIYLLIRYYQKHFIFMIILVFVYLFWVIGEPLLFPVNL